MKLIILNIGNPFWISRKGSAYDISKGSSVEILLSLKRSSIFIYDGKVKNFLLARSLT